jgi:hypothetical protein
MVPSLIVIEFPATFGLGLDTAAPGLSLIIFMGLLIYKPPKSAGSIVTT